uniref:DM domain-containing protein n=1 Tax=Loa loa TaxID=7209 RepID=A0A1I7VLB2_LOALO
MEHLMYLFGDVTFPPLFNLPVAGRGTSPGSSRNSSSGGYSSCTTPEVDVVAFTPRPEPVNEDDQKRYFCQRCLNHAQEHPRKGHKPFCQHESMNFE